MTKNSKNKKVWSLTLEFDSEFDLDYCAGQLTDGFGENYLHLDFISKQVWHCNFSPEHDEFYRHHIKCIKKYGSKDEKRMLKESGINHEGIEFDKKS